MGDFDIVLYWSALTIVAGIASGPILAPGYAAICAILLVLGPILLFAMPDVAAWAVFALTFVFVVLPVVLGLAEAALARREYTRAAFCLNLVIAALHPLDGRIENVHAARALDLRRRGRWEAGNAMLARRTGEETPSGLVTRLSLCESRRDFEAMREDPRLAGHDQVTVLTRLRVLGETGRVGEMIRDYRTEAARQPRLYPALEAPRLVPVLMFAGRPKGLAALHRGPLKGTDADVKRVQMARAYIAEGAGEVAAAEATLRGLNETAAEPVRRSAARMLADPPHIADRLDPDDAAFLDHIETVLLDAPPRRPFWRSWATLGLIAINLIVFGVEIGFGGSEDNETLYRLGGLYVPDMLDHGSWWRLITELFLHAGPIHLASNMFALLALGIVLEQMLGAWRFLLLYFGAGLGSNLLIVLLTRQGVVPEQLLVGASGAIMGLVGAAAAAALRQWLTSRSRVSAQRFVRIGAVILLQTGIDLTIPHVSVAAHLTGMAVGALFGFVMPMRWPSATGIAAIDAGGSRPDAAPPAMPSRQRYGIALAVASIGASLLIAAYR